VKTCSPKRKLPSAGVGKRVLLRFSFKRPVTPDDLYAIEKRMAELAKKDLPVTREVWPRDKAVQYFKSIGEHTRPRSSLDTRNEEVSLYREGDFIDLCRGPHVPPPGSSRYSS